MDENRFVEEPIANIDVVEVLDTTIPVVDESVSLTARDEIIEVNVDEAEIFDVVISENVGPHALKIVSDHSFDLPRQHSIGAIEGLREELDEIERLKTVYSDSLNHANYYAWTYGGPPSNSVNGIGYFVSINPENNFIKLCASDEDAVGVTVNAAGFVGGQDAKSSRDDKYALVVHSGIAAVRCELDPTDTNQPCVKAGDYVASDDNGMAKKTDGTYGYRVAAISKIDGVWHSVIALTTPTTQMQKFSEKTQDVVKRMGSAETNIAAAISVANAAYNKAQVAQDWAQGNVENIAGDVVIIGGKVDNIIADVDNLNTKVVDATTEALQAQSKASAVRTEANQANNATNSHISSLINALNPDKTWTDPENMDMWNDYFADYIKDGNIPTTSQIKELDGNLTHANSMISQNALGIENIVTSIDNYSVGEWSQAYGLNLAEAWNILKVGMIYIPTPELHTEKYEYATIDSWGDDEEKIKQRDVNTVYMTTDDGSYWRYLPVAGDGNLTYEWIRLSLEYEENGETKDYIIKDKYEFTRGYYYTWNGFYWVESESPYVYFSSQYVNPSQECQYWYVDSPENLDHEGTIYKARELYKWDAQKSKWVEINILAGNITNRATSSLIQTATEISANVTNARGWLAHMGVKITEDGSFVDQVASVVTPLLVGEDKHKVTLEKQYIFDEEPTDSIIGVEGQYYAVGTEKPYDVYIYQDGIWKKKPLLYYDGAYIIKINTSSILLSANEDEAIVSVNGPTIFTADEYGGVTGINGSCITTGTIAANDGTVKIDLGKDTACVSGRIMATSGYIGNAEHGFTIQEQYPHLVHIVPYSDTDIANTYDAGYYYFIYDEKYYSFELKDVLTEGDRITIHNVDYYKVNGEWKGFIRVVENPDIIPEDALLEFVDATYYCLHQKQLSVQGDNTSYPGVFISPEGIGLGNGNFYVTDYGNVTTQGKVTMKSNNTEVVKIENGNLTLAGNITLGGNITWETTSNPLKVLYRAEYTENPPGPDDYEKALKDTTGTTESWHTKLQSTDYYASYSYDNGANWCTPVKIQAKDGEEGQPGKTLSKVDIFNMLTDNGTQQGLFPFYSADINGVGRSQLYINAEYIKAGILSGITVNSTDTSNNIIEMSNGHIQLWPSDYQTSLVDLGMNNVNGNIQPTMRFGQGSGNGLHSTGWIYKTTTGFGMLYHPEDANTLKIEFDDTSNAIEIYGDVDFNGGTVTGLNITFG